MKRSIILLFLFISATIAFAGKGLVVIQKYSTGTGDQNISVTWYITETQCKLKMQFSDKDVNTVSYFIPDTKANTLLTYAEGNTPAGTPKTYFAIPVQNIKASTESFSLQRTGETKEVGGMSCEKIIATSNSSITEMWVTKNFNANYFQFASFFKNSSELKALSDGKIKGFPVSSVTKDNTGKVISNYEMVSVSSTDIADTEFKVPTEYKSVEEITKKN